MVTAFRGFIEVGAAVPARETCTKGVAPILLFSVIVNVILKVLHYLSNSNLKV